MHISDLKHENSSLQEKLEYLYSLRTGSKVNWNQAGYFCLLKALGNPHKILPPIIHVAGTNGKGSIIAMLRAIYEEAGYKVHTYTSPHLIHINERITLAGKPITDDMLNSLIDECLYHIGNDRLSFFEILTAIAFKAFSENPADLLLLEVGMGGRLDCTNIIENPLISIISRISLDHTEFLGDTIEKIAEEKAGIIRLETPVIIGYQNEECVTKILQQKGKHSYTYKRDWSSRIEDKEMVFTFNGQEKTLPLPSLLGEHQIHNAGAALAAIHIAQDKFYVTQEQMSKGLQNINWRGRLEHIATINNHEIWVDCGHNDSAGLALAKELQIWRRDSDSPIHLIIGMLNTKNDAAFLQPLLPNIDRLSIVPINHEPNSKNLASYKQSLDGFSAITTYDSASHAIEDILRQSSPSRILVAGSVYLAGEVLQQYANLSCK
ncbi:MAG: bifunctional folylpolyglutamate synthase/dihydrofolate synthase [Alphaproteobacteria bacterium]|nr:bifunctional folylpolyglutamate synthase/dihydrofolate synthase [Alphaproteobacteria bacterium]